MGLLDPQAQLEKLVLWESVEFRELQELQELWDRLDPWVKLVLRVKLEF
jgi:hypothetical protein